MLSKLLKYDFRKNMRWLWIIFAGAILAAGITRGLSELGKSIAFFRVLSVLFDSIFYALVVNSIVQPFIRGFMNFSKSIYGDEGYLTNTLPVTKSQIINSKFIVTICEMVLGFVTLIISLLIRFWTPTMFTTLKYMLSSVITGEFSIALVLILVILLIVVEFLMFISIIYFAIILAYKSNEKKVLKAFLYTAIMAAAAGTILSMVMVVVMLICGINLTAETLELNSSLFYSIVLTGICVYSIMIVLFYFLAKREYNKGINID